MKSYKFITCLLSIVAIHVFSIYNLYSQIINIESLRLEKSSKLITGELDFSLSLSRSNFTLLNLKTSSYLQFNFPFGTLLTIGNFSLLLQDKEELAHKTIAHLRYNHHLRYGFSLETYVQVQYDVIRSLEKRTLWGWGARWHPIKNRYTKWALGGGGFSENEKIKKESHSTSTFRLSYYLAGNILLSRGTKINLISYFQPVADLKKNDWRLSGTLSIHQYINRFIFIQTTFDMAYDSTPPINIKKLSYDWFNGISIQF